VIIVRIVKSNDCPICASYIPRLQKQGYKFDLYDGDAPQNEKQLDEWKIDKFPVVQIVYRDGKNEVVKYQFPAGKTYAPRFIDMKKQQFERDTFNYRD